MGGVAAGDDVVEASGLGAALLLTANGGDGDDIITDVGGDDNIQGDDGNDVISVLDYWAAPLRQHGEKTYSAPFAAFGYGKEMIIDIEIKGLSPFSEGLEEMVVQMVRERGAQLQEFYENISALGNALALWRAQSRADAAPPDE